MPMYNTMETPRGGRRKKSLLSTMKKSSSQKNLMAVDADESIGGDEDFLFFQQAREEAMATDKRLPGLTKRSSSTGNLMDDPDDTNGSDGDLIFFQQAQEEANAKAKAARKTRRKNSLVPKFKRSSSTGNLMDGLEDEVDDFIQSSKAASGPGRGRRRVQHLVETIKKSTSLSRLDDGSDEDELKSIQNLEDFERSILSTPRSVNKRKAMRSRSKGRGQSGDESDLGASSRHSTKSERRSRMSKSPGRLVEEPKPQGKRFPRRKSLSGPLQNLDDESSLEDKRERRIRKREKGKGAKEKRLSNDPDNLGKISLSFDEMIQQKERQESLITPRFKKKTLGSSLSALDYLPSPVEKKHVKKPGGSKASNESLWNDDSTVSTKDMTSSEREDHGYESEGRMGRKKRVPKVRKAKLPEREVTGRPELSPHTMKKQSIMNELDEMDDRESITSAYLNKQVEALKKKVADLTSENKKVNDQLNKEINENGKLALKLREHELGLAALEKVNDTSITVEVLKKEHESEKREMELLLNEKDGLIGRLQQKINSIRVANDTMQMQRESARRPPTEAYGSNVEVLQFKVEVQKAEIEELKIRLSTLSESHEKDMRQINELQGELQETKDEKKELQAELESIGKEHAKAMKRKDETIDFLQESLTQMKLNEHKRRTSGSKFGIL